MQGLGAKDPARDRSPSPARRSSGGMLGSSGRAKAKDIHIFRLFWLEIDGTGLGWLYSIDQGHLFSQKGHLRGYPIKRALFDQLFLGAVCPVIVDDELLYLAAFLFGPLMVSCLEHCCGV